MASGGYRFDDFLLDPDDRQLRRGGAPVELNARYFDALALLVREEGRLVSKDRFLDEVWRGVPVTDEALTQCIKTLRRQLGDSAVRPRFIETVPKHGYRFVAPVERVSDARVRERLEPAAAIVAPSAVAAPAEAAADGWRDVLLLGGTGTIGAGMAGLVGGIFYGFAGASQPLEPGMGAVSVLLVLVCLNILVALVGGGGVSFGIAVAARGGREGPTSIIGGAFGGMAVGAVVKLLGLDAFNLLFGRAPGEITGGLEGALLGAAIGLGAWLGNRAAGPHRLRRGVAAAALAAGAAGLLIPLLGGRMMGGSLDLLARHFPGSRLRLDRIGALIGEDHFGLGSQAVTGALEGMLFGGFIVGAMILGRRTLAVPRGSEATHP